MTAHELNRGQIYVPRSAAWTDDATCLEPDLMYISEDLRSKLKPGRRTRADIAIEVISPSTASYDRRTKSDTYRAMGIRELWLVDPDMKEIEVRSFDAGKTVIYKANEVVQSAVLSKARVRVASVFRHV